MHATRSAGDRIDLGTTVLRYAMIGDTYMTASQVGDAAGALDEAARNEAWITDTQRIRWVVDAALRLGLATDGVGYTEALMILGSAHVTWSDICRMYS